MEDADRQASTSNQAYSEYVLERLQIAIVSVSVVLNHLQTTPPSDYQQLKLVIILFLSYLHFSSV